MGSAAAQRERVTWQSLAGPTLRSAMRVHPALRGLAVLARSSGSPTMAASAASAGAAVGSQLLSVIGQVYWEDWRAGPVALNLFKCSLASCLFALVLATQAGFGIALPAISPTAFSKTMEPVVDAFANWIVAGDYVLVEK